MRRTVVGTFLVLVTLIGYAQFNYFDTIYKLNNYHAEYSYSSIRLSDNKFVMVGYAYNTAYEINIFCINTIGDTLWNMQYNVDSLGVPWVISSTLDAQKNILVAGYVSINNSAELRALLLKTDSSGNLKWIHFFKQDSAITVFGQYTGLYEERPVSTFNNQYLVLCQEGKDTGVANFLAIITDSGGNEITRWRYDNPFYEDPKFAIQTSDSGFLFGGFSNRIDSSFAFWTMYIKKVNQYGVLLWDTSIEALTTGSVEYTGDAMAEGAIEVNDGYVVAGERSNRSNFTYPNDERGWSKCWYGKFSKSDGHLLWEHYLGPDTLDFGHFYGITHTNDSGYALCGVYNYQNNTRQKGYIVKTDINGDTLWSYTITRHIGSIHNTEQMELHDIYEIEGGYMATGFRLPNWPIDDFVFPYVLTIDTNGCPDYNCAPLTGITEPVAVTGGLLLVYPNPTGSLLYVNINTTNTTEDYTIQIYDVSGRLLQTAAHLSPNQPYPINVSQFANGMYFAEILSGGNVVGRRRFVKE